MHKTWKTTFTQSFQTRLPIALAPMAGVSGGLLASQIANAGGLGMIAAGHCVTPSDVGHLEKEIGLFWKNINYKGGPKNNGHETCLEKRDGASESPSPKLCIGFIGHSSLSTKQGWDSYEHILRTYRPFAVQFFAPSIIQTSNSAGTRTSNVQLAHKYKTKFIAQIGSIAQAKEAIQHNVDAIICQGSEAGGHGLRRELGNSTMALTSQVKKLLTGTSTTNSTIPVLAAGGIVNGQHVASALCYADGVVMGTRFWASNESLGNPTLQQYLVKDNSCDDVIRSPVFDQIENEFKMYQWPHPYDSVGALRNETTEDWESSGKSLEELKNAMKNTNLLESYQRSMKESDGNVVSILAGEGVGENNSIEGAYDVLLKIEDEVVDTLERLSSLRGTWSPFAS